MKYFSLMTVECILGELFGVIYPTTSVFPVVDCSYCRVYRSQTLIFAQIIIKELLQRYQFRVLVRILQARQNGCAIHDNGHDICYFTFKTPCRGVLMVVSQSISYNSKTVGSRVPQYRLCTGIKWPKLQCPKLRIRAKNVDHNQTYFSSFVPKKPSLSRPPPLP